MNKNTKWYQNRIKKLIEINKNCPAQKSKEWYIARNTRITASEASSALPKIEEICSTYEKIFNVKIKYNPNQNLSVYDTKEEYIINKCRTFYGENLFKDNIYTLHGKKFEEISTRLYRKVFNTNVLEFGLLPHPRLKWLGASPDGITKEGVMLEIKNPNKMYYIPSITYFTQMQIQMETANLDECDFLVCYVKNIDTEQEFIERIIDESQNMLIPNSSKQYKGILLNNISESDNSTSKYIYPPDSLDTINDFLNWKNDTILEYQKNGICLTPNYYIIQEWIVIRIQRDKDWFNIIKSYLKNTIDIIKKLQSDEQLFKDYRESMHNISNKDFFEKYNNTFCLIQSEDTRIENNIVDACIENELIDTCLIHSENISENENVNETDVEDTCLICD